MQTGSNCGDDPKHLASRVKRSRLNIFDIFSGEAYVDFMVRPEARAHVFRRTELLTKGRILPPSSFVRSSVSARSPRDFPSLVDHKQHVN